MQAKIKKNRKKAKQKILFALVCEYGLFGLFIIIIDVTLSKPRLVFLGLFGLLL